jgi:hypothetical protein
MLDHMVEARRITTSVSTLITARITLTMVLCLVLRKVMSLLVEDLFCLDRIVVLRGWDACNEFECTFVTHSEKLAFLPFVITTLYTESFSVTLGVKIQVPEIEFQDLGIITHFLVVAHPSLKQKLPQ